MKITPHNTVNAEGVQAMKKLQALHNDDANKIVDQVTKEKGAI